MEAGRLLGRAGTVLLVLGAIAAAPAQAALLNYTVSGIAGSSSSLNTGTGSVNLSGASFTVSGSTVDDVDDGAANNGSGRFRATSTFDFGALGSFTTDIGGDWYSQGCGSVLGIGCVGLASGNGGGFVAFLIPPVAGNPDFGIPLGTIPGPGVGFSSVFGTVRIDTNVLGHRLMLSPGAITSITVTAAHVPAPVADLLLLVGIVALLALPARRRRPA